MFKKTRVVIISILLFVNLFAIKPIKSELKTGDSFIYEIIKTNHYFKIGKDNDSNEIFPFGAYDCPVGTKVNATVDYIEGSGSKFTFWIDSYSSIVFIHPQKLDIDGVQYSFFTLFHTYEMVSNFQNVAWVYLILYKILPFFDPRYNDYLISPETLGEDIRYYFSRWAYLYPDIECLYSHSMTDGILIFESWVGGEVDAGFGRILTDNSDYPSDISFGNNFHFAIDNETGLVQGFGLRGWVIGKIDGKSVKVSLNFQYKLENYNMQDYQFGEFINFNSENGSKSNLYYLFFLPGITTVGAIAFVVYRRKRRYKEDLYLEK